MSWWGVGAGRGGAGRCKRDKMNVEEDYRNGLEKLRLEGTEIYRSGCKYVDVGRGGRAETAVEVERGCKWDGDERLWWRGVGA